MCAACSVYFLTSLSPSPPQGTMLNFLCQSRGAPQGGLPPLALPNCKTWDEISKASGGKPPFPTCPISVSICYRVVVLEAVMLCGSAALHRVESRGSDEWFL